MGRPGGGMCWAAAYVYQRRVKVPKTRIHIYDRCILVCGTWIHMPMPYVILRNVLVYGSCLYPGEKGGAE